MELSLIKAALEDDEFSGTFQCPECRNMDDEQYQCTTCWCTPGSNFRVSDAIKTLLKLIGK